MGSEWWEPQIGHPSPGVVCKREEPPWVVGGPRRLIGGVWGAWSRLVRSTGVLACLQAEWREVCSRVAVSPVTTSASSPRPSQANAPAPLTLCHTVAPCWDGHDQEKTQTDTGATWSQGRAWVGRWWPLLALTQAAPQKPSSPTVAALHSSAPQTGRKSMRAPPVVAWGFTIRLERQGMVVSVRDKGDLNPSCIWAERGTQSQLSAQAAHQRQVSAVCGWHGPRARSGPTCFSALELGGPSVGREENTHLKANKGSLGLTFGASAPSAPASIQAVTATEQTECPTSYPAPA